MNDRPWFKFYHRDWRTDPGVRMLSRAARGDFVELLCWIYDGTSGFVEGPGGKPLPTAAACRMASVDPRSVRELVEVGCLQIVEGCPFSPKALEVLREAGAEAQAKTEAGRKAALTRWAKDHADGIATAMRPQCDRNAPDHATAMRSRCETDATRAQSESESELRSSISSVLEYESHPAPAREDDGTDEKDSDFWGPKIGALYCRTFPRQTDHEQEGLEALPAVLRTYRASDCALAIAGAGKSPWVQQHGSRQTLAGILSARRIDGHIQDAMTRLGMDRAQAEAYGERLLRGEP